MTKICHYHRLAVQIAGLPDGDFWRDNVAYAQGDPVKRHYWAWQPESENWENF